MLRAQDPSDQELLQRFTHANDTEAFAALVRRHGPMVLRACRRVLGNAHDAEDACQATFLALVHKAHSLAQPELLANWLTRVAHRTALKAKARIGRRRAQEWQAGVAVVACQAAKEDGQEATTLREDEATTLREGLERLPGRFRWPLALCYLEGLTNTEAAHRLGIPPGSISYRLARGRELLRQSQSPRGPGGGVAPCGPGPAAEPHCGCDRTERIRQRLAAGAN
jgi:RNA polymerase sigma-70 factor (ECF subfamily)